MESRSKVITPLIFLLILLVLIAPIKTQLSYFDEGLVVFNATRVIDGDVPYRDFWEIYPPGQFYVLAVIFRIFSATLFVARVYDTIVRFLIVVGVYLIVRKTTIRALTLVACIVTAVLLASARSYDYPVFPPLALGLLSISSSYQYVNIGRRRWLLLAGTLIGIATLFRWDIGLYAGISLAIALISLQYFRAAPHPTNPIRALFATSGPPAMVFGAALLIVLPCYGYLCFRSGFREMWTQVVVFPTTTLHDVRWRPYPPIIPSVLPSEMSVSAFKGAYSKLLDWLRFYFPVAAYGIAYCYYGLSLLSKRINFNPRLFVTTALTFFGALLFAQALSRYDYLHVVPSSIIAFVVLIPLARQVVLGIHKLVVRYSFLLILTGLAFLYFVLPVKFILSSAKKFSPLGCHSRVVRAGCVHLSSDQEEAVNYIRRHTSDDESIFVGNRRHDRIFVNDVAFYFLSDRPSATKYHELFPGVATSRLVQEAIVHDIESKNVKWIVLVNIPESGEPNASTVGGGAHFLDDFIRSDYSPVADFGNYGIWERITE